MSDEEITLSLPEELVLRAEAFAKEHQTSLSEIVTRLLSQLPDEELDYDEAWAAEEALMVTGIDGMRVGEITWTRDQVHTRW